MKRPPVRPSLGLIRGLVRAALAEDIGSGDITTLAVIPRASRLQARARIVARQRGVLAGLPVVRQVFKTLAPGARLSARRTDGSLIGPGRPIAVISGPLSAILAGERVALNFLARLSGIATYTRHFVMIARRHNVAILDTRKTTPLLRHLEKYAVRLGGGRNHRFGLFDAILIKDNHIAAAGSLAAAVAKCRARTHGRRPIEVEAQDMSQVHQAIAARAELIMLDNMRPPELRAALRLIGSTARVEISGGITLKNVAQYAKLRPDYISVGGLTHSAPALDFSLEIFS